MSKDLSLNLYVGVQTSLKLQSLHIPPTYIIGMYHCTWPELEFYLTKIKTKDLIPLSLSVLIWEISSLSWRRIHKTDAQKENHGLV